MSYQRKRKIIKYRCQISLAKISKKITTRISSYKNERVLNDHLPLMPRIISIHDPNVGNKFCHHILLEYSSLFPNENLEINKEIRNFSRKQLVEIILILGRNFGSFMISDLTEKPFFSFDTVLCRDRLNRINKYIIKNGYSPNTVFYACERTLLEFLKITFSIKPEECCSNYEDCIAEVKIFDLLLAINEQIVTPFNGSKNNPINLAQLMFVNMYATNEFANYDCKLALLEQIYYARTFFEFISSRKEYTFIYKHFMSIYKIGDWREYFRTVVLLSAQAVQKGPGSFSLEKNDPERLVNSSVLLCISFGELDTVGDFDNVENRDLVYFRSHPIINKLDGNYIIYNTHLIIERLYNSIYFDLLPHQKQLKYNDKSYSQFYKEIFVEKYLFDKTIISCIDETQIDICFPKVSDVNRIDFVDLPEDRDQPDFYFREKSVSYIFECKAVKLNGDLKEYANVDAIMDELKNKLLEKRWKLNNGVKKYLQSPKNEGVGQLVSHIERIENKKFKWDTQNPDNFQYYPILVLESRELLQPSISALVNEWYYNLLCLKPTIRQDKCQPLIVMTIKTLFLYSDLFKRDGFKLYFDKFISTCRRVTNGIISMSEFESFDGWMQSNYKSNKLLYFDETIKLSVGSKAVAANGGCP